MTWVIGKPDPENDTFEEVPGAWLKSGDIDLQMLVEGEWPRQLLNSRFWITIEDGENGYVGVVASDKLRAKLEERYIIVSYWETAIASWIRDVFIKGGWGSSIPLQNEDATEFYELFDSSNPPWKQPAPMGGAFLFPHSMGQSVPAEEQTEFDIELTQMGDKIKTIKAVREIITLGLKDAKDLVESAPRVIKEGISKEEAEELKRKLEEAGAVATIS